MRSLTEVHPRAAAEWAMKVQEVILQAMANQITWFQKADIADLSCRRMRRRLSPLRCPPRDQREALEQLPRAPMTQPTPCGWVD